MTQPTIYADAREASSRIVAILRKHCDVHEKNLAVGDYQLSERIAVERKRVSDFLSSLIDGRLFAQLAELRRTFERPILLIEGDESIYAQRKIDPAAINGCFATIAIDFRIPILWTNNQLESAQLLLALARREQVQLKRSISVRGKRKARSRNQEQEWLVAGLPKVNTVLAKRLLKHFGSPAAVFSASEAQLREVEGIGKILAKRIREVLNAKYEKSVLED